MEKLGMILAVLTGTLGIAAPVAADEHVQLSELPAQVRQTVERETKGAAINEIEQDTENGQLIYEVEFTRQGQRWELDVDAYGAVLDRHRD